MLRNRLFRKLTDADLKALVPHMTEVALKKGQLLLEPNTLASHVYFPLNCTCSIVAKTAGKVLIEVGMFGFEGMSNFVIKPGAKTFFRTTITVPGMALRVDAVQFARIFHELPSLNELIRHYKDFSAVQFGYSALAHGAFSLEPRLARWILMADDRSSGAALPIVHDKIASLLNVRRPGVTTAIHAFEATGAIKATRGILAVRNREKLEAIAGDCYGPTERAYDVIMGQQPDQR